jgi:hypothetical protein
LCPHVLGEFALDEFVVLLPGVALPVVKVGFVILVAVVLAETQELFEKIARTLGLGLNVGLAMFSS